MTLSDLIAEHRGMYADELHRVGRMTSHFHGRHLVPADTEAIPIGEAMVEVTDSGPLGGAPFSPDLNRRLGPPSRYGERYPWAHSWSYLRRACRNDHPGHIERPVFGGSLCWQAVSWCVVSEYTPATIASLFEIPLEDVERHLRNALRWIEEDMDRKQRIRNSRDPQPSEEPTPTRLSLLMCDAAHRQVADFDLEQRVWESQSRLHPDLKLSDWSTEWARRLNALWAHQQSCDRCRRAA
jgi:hypothetical protein